MAKSRPRERLTEDHLLSQSKLQPNHAHFVLEQVAKRLNKFQLHVFGQSLRRCGAS